MECERVCSATEEGRGAGEAAWHARWRACSGTRGVSCVGDPCAFVRPRCRCNGMRLPVTGSLCGIQRGIHITQARAKLTSPRANCDNAVSRCDHRVTSLQTRRKRRYWPSKSSRRPRQFSALGILFLLSITTRGLARRLVEGPRLQRAPFCRRTNSPHLFSHADKRK